MSGWIFRTGTDTPMCSPKVEKALVIENGEIDISLLVSKIKQAVILTLMFILMMIVDYESYLM